MMDWMHRLFACFLAAAALSAAMPAQAADDLLEPDAAFQFSASLAAPGTVRVRYQIADGYYMYRERFRIAVVESATVKLGKPRFPGGELTEDEFFGKVETYRGVLQFDVPLESAVPPDGFTLKVVSQGCADIGVCYTPLTQVAKLVAVAHSDAALPVKKQSSLLQRLQSGAPAAPSRPDEEEEFLPVEQAFKVEVRSPDPQTLVARLSPAESYYLYRDKLRFALAPGDAATIESVQIPRGEPKQDPNFGKTEVFHKLVQVVLKLKRSNVEPLQATVQVGFQGCSEKGLCYPPASRQIPVTFAVIAATGGGARAPATPATVTPEAREPPTGEISEDQQIAGMLRAGNFWLVMASFLGFGLLLSFTPCVLPMIPILSGMIAGQGLKASRWRGFVLAAAYVLGMAIAYAAAGVIAGLSGSMLSASLQNPWVLGSFAGIFVLLAFSMFGFYELQLPSAWQSRCADTSNRLSGGTLAGVFAMGALSAVIVGPCVAAPLAGALIYVSQSHDVVLGGSALFAMALGMGVPLLVVGASAGALLPKVGAWMQSVKNFFGVLLLGAAIWIVSPLIPIVAQMICWSVLLIVSGIYLRALDPLPVDAGNVRRLWKAVGLIALLLGAALLLGGLAGNRNPWQPLSGVGSRTVGAREGDPARFIRVASVAELDRSIAGAGKPVMLDFYADWCVSCKEMERFTFSDDAVKKSLSAFLLLQADVTANSAEDQALLRRFGLFGPPGIIFFNRQGVEIKASRVIGYKAPDRFLPILAKVTGS